MKANKFKVRYRVVNLLIIIILFYVITLATSCNSVRDEQSVTYFSLSINGQDGDTSYASAWEINKEGEVYLHGGSNSPNAGNYFGKLSSDCLNKINYDFFKLGVDSSAIFGNLDHTSGDNFEFQFMKGNSIFMWEGEYSKLPDSLYSFLENCYKQIKNVKLNSSDSLHSYHTKAHLNHNYNLKFIHWKEDNGGAYQISR